MLTRWSISSIILVLALTSVDSASQRDCDVDIVFLLDSSSSVTDAYDRMVVFIESIGDLLNIGPFAQRVALVTYSGAHTRVRVYDWDAFNSTAEFTHTIRNLNQISGTTFTARALGYVRREVLSTRRPRLRTVLISVTDGFSSDIVDDEISQIAALPDMLLFSAAINDKNNEKELLQLAGGHPENVWRPPTTTQQARAALSKFLKGNCSLQAQCLPTYTEEVFTCECRDGYIDVSPDKVNRPGQVCVLNANECQDGTHDCHADATCVEQQDGFTCKCKAGFTDQNPSKPGRRCSFDHPCDSPSSNDCDRIANCVKLTTSRDAYTCECPANAKDTSPDVNRFPGRRCESKRNECQTGEHNCDTNADCIDEANGFTCKCRRNYKDVNPSNPGRRCQFIHPCDDPLRNDCSPLAQCTKIQGSRDGFLCKCKTGYVDQSQGRERGRICTANANECRNGQHNCSPNAVCTDKEVGFTCECKEKFRDRNPANPGTLCESVHPCDNPRRNDCDRNADCIRQTGDAYTCRCRAPFSNVPGSQPGRKCKTVENECQSGRHNCDRNAICIDQPIGFTCQCKPGFTDRQPSNPGRQCLSIHPCDDASRNDCHQFANCLKASATQYNCQCRNGYTDVSPDKSRAPGRVCQSRTDECRTGQHDCSPNAQCIDQEVGFTCRCKPNFRDGVPTRPGRVCELIHPCEDRSKHNCHQNADCLRQGANFGCRCKLGFIDVSTGGQTGRNCKPTVDECARRIHNCDRNAICIDQPDGFTCQCSSNFIDQNPANPGRQCKPIHPCTDRSRHDCSANANCVETGLQTYNCKCKNRFIDVGVKQGLQPGRQCAGLVDECRTNTHDCSPNARCVDQEVGYTCQCKTNYRDATPRRPGRICEFIHPCHDKKRNDCSPRADCVIRGEMTYDCVCRLGFVDVSTGNKKGRICQGEKDECARREHDCHANAYCIDQPIGYTCACQPGFNDRNPAKPGRQCDVIHPCSKPDLNLCDKNAVCSKEPQRGPEAYSCRCKSGFVDISPTDDTGRRCKPTVNECQTGAHDCSPNARCTDTQNSFTCKCNSGYEDRSPSRPGRFCDFTPPCQRDDLNDCSEYATCSSVASNPRQYTCACVQGYVDKNPSKPGRQCEPIPQYCLNQSLNDCHLAAICTLVNDVRKFTCQCRDGYVDTSSNKSSKPGRQCKAKVNECLDRALNDCDDAAVCEDTVEGYNCRCKAGYVDQSDNKRSRPGRRCLLLTNECDTNLHDCSRFAQCSDRQVGWSCKCRSGYFDNYSARPGTNCSYIVNECATINLNDCHEHAVCTDTQGGYTCQCKSPYRDAPGTQPGRACRYNECASSDHDCDKNADCTDTPDGYTCQCLPGYFDDSPDFVKAGRRCIKTTAAPQIKPTSPPPGVQCGPTKNLYCDPDLGEICQSNPWRCDCRYGFARTKAGEQCVPAETYNFLIIVGKDGPNTLTYVGDYGNPLSHTYDEIKTKYINGMNQQVVPQSWAIPFLSTNLHQIDPPLLTNSSWTEGIVFNYTLSFRRGETDFESPCDLYRRLMASIKENSARIGQSSLIITPYQPDICPPEAPPCGTDTCEESLGEICFNDRCVCPPDTKRGGDDEPCRVVEGIPLTLWVLREGARYLDYNTTIGNPQHALYKLYTDKFIYGIAMTYEESDLLKDGFVTSEVNIITDPAFVNGTWDHGLFYNFTVYFIPGTLPSRNDAFTEIIRIATVNRYELGDSNLFISPYQHNPLCSRCDKFAFCHVVSEFAVRCECRPGYLDENPVDPGTKCTDLTIINECNLGIHGCHLYARCIDLPLGYDCQCNKGYNDESPANTTGRLCVRDFCSNFTCPSNTTCYTGPTGPLCECLEGFIDVRGSKLLVELGLEGATCLHPHDVNECALGLPLHDCHSFATCIDLPNGFTCKCGDDFVDGNPEHPGRRCAGAFCGRCNGRGNCVIDAETGEVTCECTDGWSGDFCEVAGADGGLILFLILAILFFLLTLCCCLYFCLKCRCVKGAKAWYAQPLYTYRKEDSGGASIISSAGQQVAIPRAQLRPEYDSESESGSEWSEEETRRRVHERTVTTTIVDGDANATAQFMVYMPNCLVDSRAVSRAMSEHSEQQERETGGVEHEANGGGAQYGDEQTIEEFESEITDEKWVDELDGRTLSRQKRNLY